MQPESAWGGKNHQGPAEPRLDWPGPSLGCLAEGRAWGWAHEGLASWRAAWGEGGEPEPVCALLGLPVGRPAGVAGSALALLVHHERIC